MNKEDGIFKKLIAYFLIFILFVFSGSAFFFTSYRPYFVLCLIILTFLLFMNFMLKIKQKKITFNLISIVLLIILIFINYISFKGSNNIRSYIEFVTSIAYAFLLLDYMGIKKSIKYAKNFLFFIACFSLVLFFIRDSSVYNFLTINVDGYGGNDAKYKWFLFYFELIGLNRNCGFFWEPGIMGTFCVVAIFMVYFGTQKHKMIYYIIFVITILTTQSSASYAILLLSIVFILFHKSYVNKKVDFWMVLTIIIAGTASLVFIFYEKIIYSLNLENEPVFYKLLSENLTSSERFNSVIINLQTFFKYPFSGIGMSGEYFNPDNIICDCLDTCTSVRMFSIFGILVGLIYTTLTVRGVFKINNMSILLKTFLLIIFLCILNKEPHNSISFTWLLLFILNRSNCTV